MLSHSKRALVAEDNAALGRVIGFTLRKSGFEVAQAANGLKAWELAQQEEFDLVVTDQQMPEMTGLELCEKLRAEEEYRDTPIILLTAKGLELEIDQIRERYGVAEMLLKPFSPSQLASVAERLVSELVL